MRRLLVSAMAGGLLAAGAWLLPAHANDGSGQATCSANGPNSVNQPVPGVPGTGFTGGVVCAQGDPTTQSG
jgi:hypothetical protein